MTGSPEGSQTEGQEDQGRAKVDDVVCPATSRTGYAAASIYVFGAIAATANDGDAATAKAAALHHDQANDEEEHWDHVSAQAPPMRPADVESFDPAL